jgi:hypothetical protein
MTYDCTVASDDPFKTLEDAMKTKIVFKSALLLQVHRLRVLGTIVTYSVEVDGVQYRIRGESTGKLNNMLPGVELLSRKSTKKNQRLASDAKRNFRSAVRKLVHTRQPFYTTLKKHWNLPHMIWRLAPRNE